MGETTGERPAPARIDDWSDPVFPPDIAELRASIVPIAEGIRLEAEPLLAEARAGTGLDDLGLGDDTDAEEGFLARLDVLLRSMREAGQSPWGVLSSAGLVTQLLRNRLLLTDLLARHPEIHDIPIERPIIIAGLPRTGTTHLHNLLAADPNLRSLPYWESLEPVLPDSERAAPGDPDPRVARTEFALDLINRSMPLFVRMHEMTADHVHEEIQLLAIDLSTMLFESTLPIPEYRDHYKRRDQTPSYRYLRTVLQALTFLRGGERWVLKSPQHLEQLPVLAEVFPDATFVVTHRDPVAVTASMCTMVAYSARTSFDHPDPEAVTAYWAPRTQDLLFGCLEGRDALPAAQSLDVRLDELVADDMAVVERVYALADQPLPDSSRRAMSAFVATHPRGRYGTVVVDPDALGLDLEERARELRPYAERFGV